MRVKDSDTLKVKIVEEALAAQGLSDSAITLDLSKFKTPVKLGEILDDAKAHIRKQKPQFFEIGPLRLDSINHILEGKNTGPIKLTEKETQLLVLLAQAGGQALSRKTILTQAWGYADDAETHTLETHIYRLRQKIETDPGKPEILLTKEDGYFISSITQSAEAGQQ